MAIHFLLQLIYEENLICNTAHVNSTIRNVIKIQHSNITTPTHTRAVRDQSDAYYQSRSKRATGAMLSVTSHRRGLLRAFRNNRVANGCEAAMKQAKGVWVLLVYLFGYASNIS